MFCIILSRDDCLYSHTVMAIVLINTNNPPAMDTRLSFSCNHKAAIGRPKKAIKKLESATCIASRFFNAVKNNIIDKKLWKTVNKISPVHVLPVNDGIFLKT